MRNQLGPYEIRGELGRGAMAVVWRAWDAKLGREVAIKEPVIPHGTSPAVAEALASRFVREGRAAAALSHPGIVTIFAADTYDGRPAIVMELIDGQPLSSVLERGALSPAAAVGIASQLLEAVGYAHGKGVVHRDIKPDNIFITADGRVKLTDFGIAHVGTGTALTQAGTVMGTPGYMAPEQVTGQPTDARADLFAIGVVLYECLTGANPFLAGDAHPTTVMYRVLNEPLPDLRATLGDAPESLAATIAVATSKDVEQRFGSAEDMRRALLGEVAVVMPKAASGVGGGKGRGVLIAAAAAVVAVVGLMAAGAFVLPQADSGANGSGVQQGGAAIVAATPVPQEIPLAKSDLDQMLTVYLEKYEPGIGLTLQKVRAFEAVNGAIWASAYLVPDRADMRGAGQCAVFSRLPEGLWSVLDEGAADDPSVVARLKEHLPEELQEYLWPPGNTTVPEGGAIGSDGRTLNEIQTNAQGLITSFYDSRRSAWVESSAMGYELMCQSYRDSHSQGEFEQDFPGALWYAFDVTITDVKDNHVTGSFALSEDEVVTYEDWYMTFTAVYENGALHLIEIVN